MKPSIIEPVTCRLVRHCLNYVRHGVLYMHTYIHTYTLIFLCIVYLTMGKKQFTFSETLCRKKNTLQFTISTP